MFILLKILHRIEQDFIAGCIWMHRNRAYHKSQTYKRWILGVPIIGTLMFLCGVGILWFHKGSLDGTGITLSYSTRQIQMEQVAMDSETFLIFMMAESISPDEEEAFLRAQAILTRSKLWYEMKQQVQTLDTDSVWKVEDMDVQWWNLAQMQKKWGENFGTYYQKLMHAVQDTACEILTYEDEIIEGKWHQVSAGYTRGYVCGNIEIGGVDGQDDLEAGAISICYWNRETAILYAQKLYPELDTKEGVSLAEQIEITKRDSSDYVIQVTAGGNTYTGEEVADLFQLPSSCFYLYDWQDGLRIVVKGQGSGYGMSLKGAARMAQNGVSEEEILQYYYPEATIRQGIF
jgi:stage II sporulation protein D